jgi:hypothetical protein
MKRLIMIIIAAGAPTGARAQIFGPEALKGAFPGAFHSIPDAPRVPGAPTF